METAGWLVALGVVAVLALGIGVGWGVTLMSYDADGWVREAEEDKQRLTEENGQLRGRLETYRTDAAKEFDAPG